MANKRTKIEAMGLADEVQSLAATGLSSRRIAIQLRADHPDLGVSESAVCRYVTRMREAARDEAFEVIRRHVDKVVPDDLQALEEMEAQCLEWAREAGKDRVDRMADAAVQIAGWINNWRVMLLEERDVDGQRVLVKKIMRDCLELMAREDRLQKNRDAAMNTAIKIIDLKLRQAGLLDDEGKGRIVIVDRQAAESRMQTDGDGHQEYRPFVIRGGKE